MSDGKQRLKRLLERERQLPLPGVEAPPDAITPSRRERIASTQQPVSTADLPHKYPLARDNFEIHAADEHVQTTSQALNGDVLSAHADFAGQGSSTPTGGREPEIKRHQGSATTGATGQRHQDAQMLNHPMQSPALAEPHAERSQLWARGWIMLQIITALVGITLGVLIGLAVL